MIWPFNHLFESSNEANQRQQVARSTSNVVEALTRQRQEALAENTAAAEDFKESVERRMDQPSPLREVLRKVIERQRGHHFSSVPRD